VLVPLSPKVHAYFTVDLLLVLDANDTASPLTDEVKLDEAVQSVMVVVW
jgi:hypothetical protein